MTQYLIVFDTDRIKEYVFATGKLTEIRGASALLEQLNVQETETVIRNICPSVEKIYCAGGSALFKAPTADAKRIIAAVEALYRRNTHTASISGAAWPYDSNRSNEYGDQVREAFLELRRVKDQKPRETHFPVAPWFHVCEACGQHPAAEVDGSQLLCSSCQCKRKYGVPQRSIFWQKEGPKQPGFLWAATQSDDHRWHNDQLPRDLDEIGDVSRPPGYVGFLYADGNSMGKVLESLRTQCEYEKFADAVDKLTRDVVHQALRRYTQPRPIGRQRTIAPFEILMMGGDDLMIVTAADLAINVAMDIVQQYEARAPDVLNVLKECKEHAFNETKYNLTLSLGLVLAHAHFPIYAMHDLAAALLKNAKKIGGSALDFAVVTASGSRDLDWLRTEVLTDHSFVNPPPQGWHYRLTQRPYQLAKFERLCHHARQLQALRFPRSQLQALYEGLFTSGIEASLRTITVIGRASEKHRRKLLDFFTDFRSSSHDIPPWSEESKKPAKLDDQPQEQHFSTALGDLIELYRFVIALAEGDEHASNH